MLSWATAVLVAWRWLRLTLLVARMPPFVPFVELKLGELLMYPLLGHASLVSDPIRLNALTKKYGASPQLANDSC